MQQLQNASECRKCARSVLEAVLAVLVNVRESAARRHGDRPTLIHMRAMGVLSKRPGATLSVLADQLALTMSATSRLVDALVDKGLIKRTIPSGNRRVVSLVLTARGRKLKQAAMRETEKELALALKRLSVSECDNMCKAMEQLRGLMEGNAVVPEGTKN